MDEQQNQFNSPQQPLNQPDPQFRPRPQPSQPAAPSAYGGYNSTYGSAPPAQSQPQPAPQFQPQPQVHPAYSTPTNQPYAVPQPQAQPFTPPETKKAGKKPIIIIGLIGIIFVIGIAMMIFGPSKKSPATKKSTSVANPTIQLTTFSVPGSSLQFSYKKGWHINSVARPSPSGQIIYLAPSALSTDPKSTRNKHLNDPELVFNVYDSNPVAGHDTLPIVAPAKKLGTISLANGSIAAMVQTSANSYGKIVVLSACENALCIFKVGNKYVSPSIQTIANASGLPGNNLDVTTANYQALVKVWQFIKY